MKRNKFKKLQHNNNINHNTWDNWCNNHGYRPWRWVYKKRWYRRWYKHYFKRGRRYYWRWKIKWYYKNIKTINIISNTCNCINRFAGNRCQYSDEINCNNSGTVRNNGSCICNTGYNGNNCQFSNEITCNGNGIAQNNGTCICNDSWSGNNCEKNFEITPDYILQKLKFKNNKGDVYLEPIQEDNLEGYTGDGFIFKTSKPVSMNRLEIEKNLIKETNKNVKILFYNSEIKNEII